MITALAPEINPSLVSGSGSSSNFNVSAVVPDVIPVFFDSGPPVYGMPNDALERLKAKNPYVNVSMISTAPKLNITASNKYVDFIIENNIISSKTERGRSASSRDELLSDVVVSLLKIFNSGSTERTLKRRIDSANSWWHNFTNTFWRICTKMNIVVRAKFQE